MPQDDQIDVDGTVPHADAELESGQQAHGDSGVENEVDQYADSPDSGSDEHGADSDDDADEDSDEYADSDSGDDSDDDGDDDRDEAVVSDAESTGEQASGGHIGAGAAGVAMATLPVTGEPRVDDALARLADLGTLPVDEHVGVFEDVQRRLHDTLADLSSQ